MTPFETAFQIVIGEEGGLSTDPADPGNWTGGARGRGVCKGTKYGIAASAHPTLDIPALTLADAQAIYQAAYWSPVLGDELPPPIALLVFDAAVNCGVQRAIHWLQAATRTPPGRTIAPETLTAIRSAPDPAPNLPATYSLCAAFQAERLAWMAALPTWRVFGAGWSRRLCLLPYQSLSMGRPE